MTKVGRTVLGSHSGLNSLEVFSVIFFKNSSEGGSTAPGCQQAVPPSSTFVSAGVVWMGSSDLTCLSPTWI